MERVFGWLVKIYRSSVGGGRSSQFGIEVLLANQLLGRNKFLRSRVCLKVSRDGWSSLITANVGLNEFKLVCKGI